LAKKFETWNISKILAAFLSIFSVILFIAGVLYFFSTNVLHNIQKAEYPRLADEVEELKSASESIKPGVLTLEQKDAVKNYFAKASGLLQKMN
jgi:cbb3-type cytochrome oxidase subunit 3